MDKRKRKLERNTMCRSVLVSLVLAPYYQNQYCRSDRQLTCAQVTPSAMAAGTTFSLIPAAMNDCVV